jgi:hypothetical protein
MNLPQTLYRAPRHSTLLEKKLAKKGKDLAYRELNFTVTEWQQQGQLISTGPGGLLPAWLSQQLRHLLLKFRFCPARQQDTK